jgi:hypothetical protein
VGNHKARHHQAFAFVVVLAFLPVFPAGNLLGPKPVRTGRPGCLLQLSAVGNSGNLIRQSLKRRHLSNHYQDSAKSIHSSRKKGLL